MTKEERDAEMQYAETPAGMGDEHMIEPERDAEMLGEIVSRYPGYPGPSYLHGGSNQEGVKVGRWHAEPVAVALVEVVEAAYKHRDAHYVGASEDLWDALDNLDAALGGGRNG